MNTFLKINCIKCNQMVQVIEEKKQEQLVQLSLGSSRLQHSNEPDHIPINRLTLSANLNNKIKAFGQKLSLKSTKKNEFRSIELSKASSKQNLHQISAQYRFKPPKPKVIINYRPSSFTPSFIHEQPQKKDLFPQFKQENEANICNLSKMEQKSQLNYQNGKEQFKQLMQQSGKRSRYINKQLKEQTITKEYSNNQNNNIVESFNQEIKVVRKKKVHFTQFRQKQDEEEKQGKHRDKFSAFGSIVNLNQRISNDDLEEYNSTVKTFVQTNQNIIKISQIEDQSQHEIRRIVKKNMTYFQQGQKRFVGVKTVYTLKSIENPSERSFLDLNYMQNQENSFRNKLLM